MDASVATYSHAEQMQAWKEIPWTSPIAQGHPRVFVPQKMYRPHTTADRRRYVEGQQLMAPVVFEMKHPDQYGVSLVDALSQRMKHLQDKDELMFANCGPSASIRIEVRFYAQLCLWTWPLCAGFLVAWDVVVVSTDTDKRFQKSSRPDYEGQVGYAYS